MVLPRGARSPAPVRCIRLLLLLLFCSCRYLLLLLSCYSALLLV